MRSTLRDDAPESIRILAASVANNIYLFIAALQYILRLLIECLNSLRKTHPNPFRTDINTCEAMFDLLYEAQDL